MKKLIMFLVLITVFVSCSTETPVQVSRFANLTEEVVILKISDCSRMDTITVSPQEIVNVELRRGCRLSYEVRKPSRKVRVRGDYGNYYCHYQ